jgi:hypothetical protein
MTPTRVLPVLAAAALAVTAGGADASTLEMRLTYGDLQLVVQNDPVVADPNDVDPAETVIQFRASTVGGANSANAADFFGVGFTFLDAIGSLCTICPQTLVLDLQATNPVAAADAGSPNLVVEVSATDFTLPLLTPWFGEASLTGIPRNGMISSSAWWDPGNALYATTNLLGAVASGSTFGQDFFTTWGDVNSPYSMTLVMEFNLTGQTQTMQAQSQARLSAIPVPAALPLLLGGLGMLGALGARRRRD